MRTTLSLDDDVLAAARALAARQGRTLGEVVSELARQSLSSGVARARVRNGIRLMPATRGSGHATLEQVNQLRDESP